MNAREFWGGRATVEKLWKGRGAECDDERMREEERESVRAGALKWRRGLSHRNGKGRVGEDARGIESERETERERESRERE